MHLRRRLLQSAGWLVEWMLPLASPDSSPGSTQFKLALKSPLRAGWYMVEVVHSSATIGADCAVDLGGNNFAHLQLSAKSVSKRIIHVPEHLLHVLIIVDSDAAVLQRFGLKRLTRSFAQQRMRNKITYSGNSAYRQKLQRSRQLQLQPVASHVESSAGDSPATSVHDEYQRYMHRHVTPPSYSDWRVRYDVAANVTTMLDTRYIPAAVDASQVDTAPMETGHRASSSNSVVVAGTAAAGMHLWLIVTDQPVEHSCELGEHLLLAIKAATDAGLSVSVLAQGQGNPSQSASGQLDYICVLAPCARLVENALIRLASVLNPGISLLYPDHDLVDATDGHRHSPAFKPEWNPELLLNTNYIGHFFVCRADWLLIEQLPIPRCWNDAEQLLLRACSKLKDSAVLRVPEVLVSISTPRSVSVETWQAESGSWAKQVEAALTKIDQRISVYDGLLPDSARVRWPLPALLPSVDIIIPTRDRVDLLRACVTSLLTTTQYAGLHITIVDNDSVEPATFDYYQSLADDARVDVLPIRGEFNYSAINNAAVEQSTAEVLVLLNNDTEILHADWLLEMVRHAVRPEVGCVGAKLYYSNGLIQHGGVVLGVTGVAGHAHRFQKGDSNGYCGRLKMSQNFSAVTAACLAVRRDVYLQVGGLDEIHLKVAYNDVDFCLKVSEAGYRNLWTPYAELYHHESMSRGADDNPSKVLRARSEFVHMQARWASRIAEDPAYNPNLTLDHEDFGWLA